MKAVVFDRYGPPDVLYFTEIEKPEPSENEVQIQIYASTVVVGDCEFRSFRFPLWFWLPLRLYSGLLKPKRVRVLGQDLAGVIVKLGSGVDGFAIGDEVIGAPEVKMGGHGEFVCLDVTKRAVAVKPKEIGFEIGVTIPTGGLNAIHYIRKAKIKAGDRVLINGAAGNIGSFAVQLAKDLGAHVSCVDRHDKLDMLRSIGADQVIDYMSEDFTQSGVLYDVILDVVGKSSFSRSMRSLRKDGRYVLANPRPLQMIRGVIRSAFTQKKVYFEFAKYTREHLDELIKMCADKRIQPVIDRVMPIRDIVAAHAYVDSGDKIGNVVITISAADFGE